VYDAALARVWEELRVAMANPLARDVDIWHRVGRFALVLGERREPLSAGEVAAVVGEALLRCDDRSDKTKTLLAEMTKLAGPDAFKRVAKQREAHAKTFAQAAAGDDEAQFALSQLYDPDRYDADQTPVLRDWTTATDWLRSAVEGMNTAAMIRLAYHHEHGLGVRRDLDQAEQLLTRAFQLGDWNAEPPLWNLYYRRTVDARKDAALRDELVKRARAADTTAMHQLGLMMRRGRGGPRDYQGARKYFEACWGAGVARAAVRLGAMSQHGEGVRPSGKAAVEWYKHGSDKGDAVAHHYLGQIYASGAPGVQIDLAESAKWFRLAAEQGYADSQARLGAMYGLGMGVQRDPAQSYKWELLAARGGNMAAVNNLAMTYYHGRNGIPRDYAKAAKWLTRADAAGWPTASNMLGLMHERGLGMPKNYGKAMACYLKVGQPRGRNKGLPDAQVNIGRMYLEGLGVAFDNREAVRWIQRAADQNYGKGLYQLGRMYEEGKGVDRNLSEAIELYKKAAKRYSADARTRLKELEVEFD